MWLAAPFVVVGSAHSLQSTTAVSRSRYLRRIYVTIFLRLAGHGLF